MHIVINLILAAQMLSALAMIGLILVQHGKGADMGAAFGSGGAGSLFGASGSANFLSRTTAVLAAIFFCCTLALAYFGNLHDGSSGNSVLDRISSPTAPVVPAVPVDTGPASQIPGNAAPKAPATAPAGTVAPAGAAASSAPPPVSAPKAN